MTIYNIPNVPENTIVKVPLQTLKEKYILEREKYNSKITPLGVEIEWCRLEDVLSASKVMNEILRGVKGD